MKLNKKTIGLIVTSVVALGGICIGTIFLQKNTESEKNYCSNMYNLEQIFQEQKEVEIGSTVPTIKDFLTNANELTECSLDNLELSFEDQDEFIKDNKLIKTGNYTYVISNKKDEYGFTYTLKVVDTNQPQVELQDLTIKEGEEYKITDFIVSVTDNSNEEVTYNYVKEEMGKYSKSGEYEIKILFKDKSGNEYEDSTTLKIEKSDNQKEESSSKSTTSSNKTSSNNTSTTPKSNSSSSSTSKGSSTSGGSTTSKSNSTSGSSTNKSSTSSGSSSSNDTTSSLNGNSNVNKTQDSQSETKRSDETSSQAKDDSSILEKSSPNYKSGTFDLEKENEFLNLINEYRKSLNLTPFSLHTTLQDTSRTRSYDIAKSFSHTRPNGTSPFTLSSKIKAENISKGYSTSQSAFNGFKTSAPHNKNMTNASYTTIGISCYKFNNKYFWVIHFGK